jgi:hypothetical protein
LVTSVAIFSRVRWLLIILRHSNPASSRVDGARKRTTSSPRRSPRGTTSGPKLPSDFQVGSESRSRSVGSTCSIRTSRRALDGGRDENSAGFSEGAGEQVVRDRQAHPQPEQKLRQEQMVQPKDGEWGDAVSACALS